MPKIWEPRVGKLFHPDYFPWTYKAPDSPRFGGQPRIDYLACDVYGRFWMVEVKQLQPDRKSINIENDVPIGQRNALDAVSDVGAVAALAVGCGSTLYVFLWERVRWLQSQGMWPRLPLNKASVTFHWTGPTDWSRPTMGKLWHRILSQLTALDTGVGNAPIQQTATPPTPPFDNTEPSPLTLKRTDYIRMLDETGKVVSEQSSFMPEDRATSFENSLRGGGISSQTLPLPRSDTTSNSI